MWEFHQGEKSPWTVIAFLGGYRAKVNAVKRSRVEYSCCLHTYKRTFTENSIKKIS